MPKGKYYLLGALKHEQKNGAYVQKVLNDLVNKAIAGYLEAMELIWETIDKLPADSALLGKLVKEPPH